MITVYQESCLKKITHKSVCSLKGGYNYGTALINEEFAYQIVLLSDSEAPTYLDYELHAGREKIKIYSVKQIPVCYPHREDDPYPDYLSDEPCILPDCLVPINNRGVISVSKFPTVLWVTVTAQTAGDHPVILRFRNGDMDFTTEFNLHVVDLELKRDRIDYAAFMYPNGVAEPYDGLPFTDIYWIHIKDYFRVLAENGVTELYVPLFPTIHSNPVFSNEAQMIEVSVLGTEKNPQYKFNFDMMDCWLYMAEKFNFKHYILPSFYPDIKNKRCVQVPAIGTDGRKTTLFFGENNDCTSNYYFAFMRQFFRQFKVHIEEMGLADKFQYSGPVFPRPEDSDEIIRANDGIRDVIRYARVYTMVDSPEAYRAKGIYKTVVPMSSIESIRQYGNMDESKIYIDVDSPQNPINQLIASPSVRLRSLSVYCLRYGITSFVNFGVNCVNTFELGKTVNPIYDTDNENCYPSGSLSLIYPAPNGVFESIRLKQLFYAMQDLVVMKTATHTLDNKIIKKFDEFSTINYRRCLVKDDQYLKIQEFVRKEIESNIDQYTHY